MLLISCKSDPHNRICIIDIYRMCIKQYNVENAYLNCLCVVFCLLIMIYLLHVNLLVITLCVCLFVYLILSVCLSVYVGHDVCPVDLTMKGWCHTNTILHVHSFWSFVVQVMFHALMTSSMTSAGHKVGQILILLYLAPSWYCYINISARASGMFMAILLVYSTSTGILVPVKNFSRPQNGRHFDNLETFNTASFWPQIWKERH